MNKFAKKRVIFVNRVFAPDRSATSRLLTDLVGDVCLDRPVWVLCSRTCYEQRNKHTQNLSITRLPWGRVQPASMLSRAVKDIFFLAAVFLVLVFGLRRGDLIVVKTDPPILLGVVSIAARLRGCSHVGWHQDIYPEIAASLGVMRADGLAYKLLDKLQGYAIRQSSFNVAIGNAMGRHLETHGSVRVIPNWSVNPRMPDAQVVLDWRRELGLERCFVVSHSGNFGRAHPAKPIADLVRSFSDDKNIKFLFSGGGYNYNYLRTTLPTTNNKLFMPFQPEERLPELLGLADVHLVVLGKKLENLIFPSKIAGVFAAGRACLYVGDANGEIAKLIRDFDCGLAFNLDDLSGLERALRNLRENPQDCSRMGKNARRAYDEVFERDRAVAAWNSLIESELHDEGRLS